jgi:class 3 adenylate cyclase
MAVRTSTITATGRSDIRRRAIRALSTVVVSLIAAAAVQSVAGDAVGDALVPTDVDVDPRLVVVVFDAGETFRTGSEVGHLRATYYRDIATVAVDAGARAIGYVDFDSQGFSDGGGGRSNVIGSAVLQQAGVAPLLDPRISSSADRIPFAPSYRVDPLASELAGVGMPTVDEGGVTRTVPGLVRVERLDDGAIVDVPEFAREAADRAARTVVPGMSLRLVELGTERPISAPSPDSVQIGDATVPLEDGLLRVTWSDQLDEGDDTHVIDLATLFTAELPDDLFTDAIVLVGTVDPSKTSYIDTPVGAMPEVLVQANAVNTLLTGNHRHPGSPAIAWMLGFVAAAALVALPRTRWWPVALLTGAFVVGWLATVSISARHGTLLEGLLPAAAAAIAAVLVVGMRQLDALADRRRIRSLFAQYVPSTVAEQLVASGRGDVATAGERVALTALFCDLRGFTPLAARLEPTQVRELLNIYYDQLARVIFDDGGTVLQYTGDEIFAVFGAPLPRPHHAAEGLACARHLFEHQQYLNDALLQQGLPALNFGIGVHSGDAIAAHVGSSVRMQYSVIGDTINVASRFCTLAREGQIMVSDVTAALIGPIDDAERIDEVRLKGVDAGRHAFLIQAGPNSPSGSPALVAD